MSRNRTIARLAARVGGPLAGGALAGVMLAGIAGCTDEGSMPTLAELTIGFDFPSDAQRNRSANAHAWVLSPRFGATDCEALMDGSADPFDANFTVLADVAVTGAELDSVTAFVPEGPALIYAEAADFRGSTHLAGCTTAMVALPSGSISISFTPVGVVDCAEPGVRDGARCDDGDVCTVADTCSGGECMGGRARDCSPVEDQCNAGACRNEVGCIPMPVADGTACDDGVACTTGEACMAGRCTGGDPSACCPGPDCIEHDCTDGEDDDEDGQADCDDADCFQAPACVPPEHCSNGIDDDRDGRSDCEDFDCVTLPACAGCTPACPDADLGTALGLGVAVGDTSSSCDRRAPACSTEGAPDITYAWRAPSAGTYRFRTGGSSFTTVLEILEGCAGASLGCDTGFSSEVEVTLTAGQMVVIVIDGEDADSGRYQLSIQEVLTSEAGLCDDGVDNDEDFDTDCRDADCAEDPVCQEICDDGIDNDLDFDTDCRDADCVDDPACQEICDDGVDNDLDFDTDCRDADCADDPACQEVCSGGDDEDLDGRVDCDDADCIGDPACGELGMCGDSSDNDSDGDSDCDDSECACASSCFGPSCIDRTTSSTFISGSTSGQCNHSVGSCVASTSVADDYGIHWGPATVAGPHTFETTYATFDSAVYVIDGSSCGGSTVELGCHESSSDELASVTVSLGVGQSVLVVVDGTGEEEGSFELRVIPPTP